MGRATVKDVAARAGVSPKTVSNVMNRPDRVAQAMASRRTDLIGMIVPDARQPFFAEMTHAVEQAASERGKMVLVGNSDYVDEREAHYLRAFLGMRVSGLILVSHGLTDQAAAEIDAWDARVVLLHERPEAIDDVAVGDAVVAVAADGARTHRQVVATITGHGAKDLVGLTLVGSGGGGPPAGDASGDGGPPARAAPLRADRARRLDERRAR